MPGNGMYELRYLPEKNRIDWKIRGYWRSPDDVPEVEDEWDEILRLTTPGFTVLADMTEMVPCGQDVETIHVRIQARVLEAGVRRVATLVPDSAIACLAGKRVGKLTGMIDVGEQFSSKVAAIVWLEEE